MNNLVSIIVPCYNQANYLEECFQSVLNQTYINWECIMVNDGSSDNTEEICEQWCKNDSRFIYIGQNNEGVSKARNTGIENCKGNYILPLDGDDKISENYVELCLKNLQQNPDTKIVYGPIFRFGAENAKWEIPSYKFENFIFGNCIHCSGMFRKNEWVLNNGYDENMKFGIEDWEFWLNMLKRGGNVTCIKEITFFYRSKHQSRNTTFMNDETYLVSMQNYIHQKHLELYKNYSLISLKNQLNIEPSIATIFSIILKKIKRKF